VDRIDSIMIQVELALAVPLRRARIAVARGVLRLLQAGPRFERQRDKRGAQPMRRQLLDLRDLPGVLFGVCG